MILPERKLYGRHKGHKLSIRQDALVNSLLPQLRVDHQGARPDDLKTLFPKTVSEIHFEIGFGGGEHLAFRAGETPEVGFIGCEPFVNGVAKLLCQIEDDNLDNVRLHDDDARMVLDWLPDACLSKVYILFPDPWPKKKHHKRRFVSTETLSMLARVMKSGAKLHLASDIPDYIRTSMIAIMNHSQYRWLDNGPSDWKKRPDRPITRYEQKALDAGRVPVYLTFERV